MRECSRSDVICAKAADGSGEVEVLLTDGGDLGSISPDGRFLAFQKSGDIWILPLENGGSPRPFLDSSSAEYEPVFSPDGRWLAYVSDESNQPEVYVQPFPGSGRRWHVSGDGGDQPKWSANGEELFYLRNDSQFFAVAVATEPTFSHGKPQLLFERTNNQLGWEVFPDGQHFVIVHAPEKPTQIKIVLNWTEELKLIVPSEPSLQ